MSLKDIQKDVDEWTSQFTPQYWPPHEILARLMEEVGELAREINHLYGTKKKKPTEETREMAAEIADIIFTLCCLANSQKIDLDRAWQEMMTKYRERDAQRYAKK
ncbi:MAG: nucleotide pyrophosphohydrolase [Candidatus Aenigmarchaeota archaeon]|nr:nucleotide pyrophosphohydrolase [Candidatus Aenigmarchaeota archaeon]